MTLTANLLKGSILFTIVLLSMSLQAQITDTDSTGLEKDVLIIPYKHLSQDLKINEITVADGNKIWAATSAGAYQLFASSSLPYLADKEITAITEVRKGNMWAGGGAIIYDITTGEEHKLPEATAMISDMAYGGGKIWIATDKGIYTFNPKTGRFKRYTEKNSKLKSNKVNFITSDEQKIIWAGTDNGYVRIEGDDWDSEDKGYDIVKSRNNKEGQWMLATDDMWLINQYNRKFPVGLDESLYRGAVNDFVIDGKGRLYMASNILIRYDPLIEKIEAYGAEVGLLAKRTISLACDFNNNIWIGTESSGLFRIVFADIAEEQLSANVEMSKGASCYGEDDAAVEIKVIGGTKPYKYNWSESSYSGKKVNGMAPGKYQVTVTDKNKVEIIADVVIPQLVPIEVSLIESKRISSETAKDGYIEISGTGGAGNLSYNWDNGMKGTKITNLSDGQYIVTITDANRCEVIKSYSVKRAKTFDVDDASQLTVGQTLRINNLYFLADSSSVTEDNFEVLDEVFEFLSKNKKVVIEVGGHTNTVASNAYSDALSKKRAQTVAEYLYNKGIAKDRVQFKGYGKRAPITQDQSKAGKQKNQRVEVKILSI